MGKAVDLGGRKFNRLTVIEGTKERVNKRSYWTCVCDCGNKTKVRSDLLLSEKTKSCGCLKKETTAKNGRETARDMTNGKFGKLKVIKKTSKRKFGNVIWLCKCDCGNIAEVKQGYLVSGHTKSCGCINKEIFIGENNPRYNPNLSDEERILKRYVLGKEGQTNWRITIFKRDNYTCQKCSKHSGNGSRVDLNAHHINGYDWAISERFDTRNGSTLCVECHRAFHSEYGYGKNTNDQFEQFMETNKILATQNK